MPDGDDLADLWADAEERKAEALAYEEWLVGWRLANRQRLLAMARPGERTFCDHCEAFFYGSGHPCTADDTA